MDSLVKGVTFAFLFNTVLFAAMTMKSDPDMPAGHALLAVGFPLALATTLLGALVLIALGTAYQLYAESKKELPDAR